MNLLNKYKSLSAPVKASMWFLICGFLQKGVSMFTTPIFTRIFTPEQFGVYSVYQSWYNIVSIIAGLNLAAGVYTKGLIKNEDDQDVFSSSLLGLSLTSSLACMVVYYIFSPFFNRVLDMSTLLMTAMFVTALLSNGFAFWSNRERVHYKYKKLTLLTCLRVLSGPVIGVIAVINASNNFKVEARVLTEVLVELVFFGWVYFYIFKKGKRFYHKEYWKYALLFNLPLILHYLSKIVLAHSDKIMISSIIGDREAGFYSVANSISHIINIFNTAILNTLNPWVYRSMKDKKYREISKIGNTLLIFLAALNLAVIVFGPEIIAVMAPSDYSAAVWVIPPAAASIFFTFVYNIFTTIEFNFDKTKFVMLASIICAVVNVGLNYTFLMLFKDTPNGFVAAAYTTFVCYVLLSVAHFVFMKITLKRELGGQRVYNGRLITLICIAFVLVAGGVTLLYPFPVARYAVIVIMLVLALVFKNKLIAVFKKLKNKG